MGFEENDPSQENPSFIFLSWNPRTDIGYSRGSTGEFVYAHGLVANDFILIYQNVEDGRRYITEARKEGQDVSPRMPTVPPNNVVIDEPALGFALPELLSLDDAHMLDAYDTTYLDDSPFKYMGDPINLPIIGSDSSFEAIDDYNPEDFEFE